jgi:hypothetical protein
MSWQQGQQTGAMGAVRQSQNARARVVVHSGWLRKQGDVRKNWKKRWFELTNDFTLRYYDAQTEPREQKGAIVLHMYRVEAPMTGVRFATRRATHRERRERPHQRDARPPDRHTHSVDSPRRSTMPAPPTDARFGFCV